MLDLIRISIASRVENFSVILVLISATFAQEDLDFFKTTTVCEIIVLIHVLRSTSFKNAFQLLLADLLLLSLANVAVHFIMDTTIVVAHKDALTLCI